MKKRTFNKVIFVAFSCQFLSIPLFAQQQKVDTTHTYSIPEITVSDIYQTREVRSTAPLQVFSKDALKNLHALQVSDAVKHFAGVTVKDYGGIGGLKKVSIRSLGAQHTAVGYDGITLTDCQTGQIDIGRFSLDNVDRLSLNNGLPTCPLLRVSRHIEYTDTHAAIHQRQKDQYSRSFQNRLLGINQSLPATGTTIQ